MQNTRKNKELSEETIKALREHPERGKWMVISRQMNLSKEFMYEFKDYIKWNQIAEYKKLDEDTMREFSKYFDFKILYVNQNLSYDFMREFKSKIPWAMVVERNLLYVRRDIRENNVTETTLQTYLFAKEAFNYIKHEATKRYYEKELNQIVYSE